MTYKFFFLILWIVFSFFWFFFSQAQIFKSNEPKLFIISFVVCAFGAQESFA